MSYENTKTILDYMDFKNNIMKQDNNPLLKPKSDTEIIALYFLESDNYPLKFEVIKWLINLDRKDIIKYMFKNMTKEQLVKYINDYNKSENTLGFKNDAKRLLEKLIE